MHAAPQEAAHRVANHLRRIPARRYLRLNRLRQPSYRAACHTLGEMGYDVPCPFLYV